MLTEEVYLWWAFLFTLSLKVPYPNHEGTPFSAIIGKSFPSRISR
jgi:hypothetical protein